MDKELNNSKTFQLPEEFLTKWLEALRSGKYNQGDDFLYTEDEEGYCAYCCLGVALVACTNVESEDMHNIEMPHSLPIIDGVEGFPKELEDTNSHEDPILADILVGANDGLSRNNVNAIVGRYPGLLWPDKAFRYIKYAGDYNPTTRLRLSFEEIAEFLEHNVEGV